MPGMREGPTRSPSVRPRYSRITLAGTSVLVTLVAVLGGSGLLPSGEGVEVAYAAPARDAVGPESSGLALAGAGSPYLMRAPEPGRILPVDDTLPEDSGEGRRVVFDMSRQRVWLVGGNERVRRTYLVSGSLTDNLGPGTYEVYSKSVDAIGVDDSGTMRYMVRFTHGDRAAIGFHDIPVDEGRKVQTRAQLGTPQSHGCIRQWRPDARALWEFAPVGATVVVVA